MIIGLINRQWLGECVSAGFFYRKWLGRLWYRFVDVLASSLDYLFCCVVVSADVLLDIGQQWTGTPSPHYRLSIMNGGHCHSYQMELVCWTALIRITLPLEIILACTPSWSLQLLIMQCSQQCIVSLSKYAAGSSWDLVE